MENEVTPPATPANGSPAPVNPVAAPPSPAPGEEWRQMSNEAFSARLKEEREAGTKALLKQLGVEKAADIKAALDKARELGQAQMTEAQKLQARLAELEPKASQVDDYAGVLATYATQEFNALPEPAQKYIEATTGDNALARLKAITAARESGLLAALTAKTSAVPAEPPRAPNPATTIAPPGPSTPKPAGTLNPYEQWEALKAAGKEILAAKFYTENHRAIAAARPTPK